VLLYRSILSAGVKFAKSDDVSDCILHGPTPTFTCAIQDNCDLRLTSIIEGETGGFKTK
jgi:hypothetical protein